MKTRSRRMIGSRSLDELTTACANAKTKGHEFVLLSKATPGGNSPRNWDRCYVVKWKPSLMGRCVRPGAIVGTWLFEVRTSELDAWLKAVTEERHV